MTKITIGKRHQFDSHALAEMYRLRAKVFAERMGWEVTVLSGMEIDDYDALAPYYMLVRDEAGDVCGCWRMLPTEGPYMLRDTFPQLLYGASAPREAAVWELSRFAILSEPQHAYGFAQRVLEAMREVVRFADRMGIASYVTVTTPAVERLLRAAGVLTRRFGPPMRVGVAQAVALTIDLDARLRRALFGPAREPVGAQGADCTIQPAAGLGATAKGSSQRRGPLTYGLPAT